MLASGVTGGGGSVVECPRDFPPGNFWRLIGKNVARRKGKKMEKVEENKEKGKREGGK